MIIKKQRHITASDKAWAMLKEKAITQGFNNISNYIEFIALHKIVIK